MNEPTGPGQLRESSFPTGDFRLDHQRIGDKRKGHFGIPRRPSALTETPGDGGYMRSGDTGRGPFAEPRPEDPGLDPVLKTKTPLLPCADGGA